MKILLIQLYSGPDVPPVYPLGLSYLASNLEGHEVKGIDQNTCSTDPFLETAKTALSFNPDVVGISIRNLRLYSCGRFLRTENFLRQTLESLRDLKECYYVLGGSGFSLFPERFLRDEPRVDFGVFLEGEQTFAMLLENLSTPEQVPGIFYRKNGQIVYTKNSTLSQFEKLPAPRRDIFPVAMYQGPDAIGVQTRRGCSLKCIYCDYPYLNGATFRLRSPIHVVDEIEMLKKQNNVKHFMFADSIFNVPKSHAVAICKEMIRRRLDVSWGAWFHEKYFDEQFMDLVIEAGCTRFEFSPDGYTNGSLQWLKKGIRTTDIHRVYGLLRKKRQVEGAFNFMVGIPGQGMFGIFRLICFCLKIKVFLAKRVTLYVTKLGIEPRTEIAKIAIEEGKITPQTDLYEPTFYCVGLVKWIVQVKRCIRASCRLVVSHK